MQKFLFRLLNPCLIALMLFAAAPSQAQVTLFEEDFEGSAHTWTSYSFFDTYDNYWGIDNTGCSYNGYSLQIQNQVAFCDYDNTISQDIISYTGVDATSHDSLVLQFIWQSLGEPNYDYGSVWYSLDSIVWERVQTGGNGDGWYEDRDTWQHTAINLPDAVWNTNFLLAISWSNDGSIGTGPAFVVDDIIITGVETGTAVIPVVTSTRTWTGTFSPYWDDSLNWSPVGVPTIDEDVIIPAGTPNTATIMKPYFGACHNLDVYAGANMKMTDGCGLSVTGNIQSFSNVRLSDGEVKLTGTETQNVQWPGTSEFYNLVVNNTSTGGITLASNLKVRKTLTLIDGNIFTGGDTVIMHSAAPAEGTSILAYNNGSYIAGNLTHYISPNNYNYIFPVGYGTDTTLHVATIMPQGLLGVNYITATFVPLVNHDNREMTAQDDTMHYTNMCSEGVWLIEPDQAPTAGHYDVKLSIDNLHGPADNNFALLKRPAGSHATAWSNGGGILPVANNAGRVLSNGYARRDSLTDFSEFGVAMIPAPNNNGFHFANQNGGRVIIEWSDSLFRFHTRVLRSIDGVTFIALPISIYSSGNGFKTTDESPLRGLAFYCLESTDEQGNVHRSEAMMVNTVDYVEDHLSIFPNPGNGKVTVKLRTDDLDVTVIVSDMNGNVIYNYASTTSGSLFEKTIDLSQQLAQGYYFIRVITPAETYIRKISVVR